LTLYTALTLALSQRERGQKKSSFMLFAVKEEP